MKEMATMQGVVTHDSHLAMQILGKMLARSFLTRLCNQSKRLTVMLLLH